MRGSRMTGGRRVPYVLAWVGLCALLLGGILVACGEKKEAGPAADSRGTVATPAPDAATTQPEAAQGSPTKMAAIDGEKLLKERCTKCHNLKRVDAAKYDRTGWEKTVGKMLKKPGGEVLNDPEAKAVVDYLASR